MTPARRVVVDAAEPIGADVILTLVPEPGWPGPHRPVTIPLPGGRAVPVGAAGYLRPTRLSGYGVRHKAGLLGWSFEPDEPGPG